VASDSPRTEFKRFRDEALSEAVAYRVARDGRGHLYVLGINFNVDNASGQRLGGVIRLNESDGSVDPTFRLGPTLQNVGLGLAVQADGKILVGGILGRFNPGATASQVFRCLSSGSIDQSFAAPLLEAAKGENGYPRVIQMLADGSILVGGQFETVAGQPRSNLVKLKPDGTVDDSFRPPNLKGMNFQNVAASILVDALSGRIMVGGFPNSQSGPAPVVRLNLNDGSQDPTFTPSGFSIIATGVRGIQKQPDGKIALAGSFMVGGQRRQLIRINAEGSLDPTFAVVTSQQSGGSTVRTLLQQPDGKLITAGAKVVRYYADGSLDSTFTATTLLDGIDNNTSLGATAYTALPADGGQFYMAGGFTMRSFIPGLLRFSANGTTDASFRPPRFAAESYQVNLARRSDGDLWAWGNFDTVDGLPRPGLARLKPDGTMDITTNPQFGPGYIDAIPSAVVQPDDRIIVTSLNYDDANNGTTFPHFSRLSAEGQGDIGFLPPADLQNPQHFWPQPDGKLIAVDDSSSWIAFHRTPAKLVRLNANGTSDNTFVSYANSFGGLTTGLVDVQGSAGQIDSLSAGKVSVLAQLQSGRLLLSVPTPASNWRLLTVGADGGGAVFLGGEFAGGGSSQTFPVLHDSISGNDSYPTVNSPSYAGPEHLHELPDGRLLIAGQFTNYTDAAGLGHSAHGLICLNGDGTFNPAFNLGSGPGLNGTGDPVPAVDRIITDPQGRLWLVGEFDSFNGRPVPGVARLKADGSLDETLNMGVQLGSYYTWTQARHDLIFTPEGAIYLVGQYVRPGEVWPHAITKLVRADMPPPVLTIANTAGQVVLTWPNSATGYLLEETGTLSPGFSWRLANGIITHDGDYFSYRANLAGAPTFYRLRQL
jgi:uncharacterized delta-60 repeat protein